jgi:nitrite reductase/ring-hydroxylating ferredoxin subunit
MPDSRLQWRDVGALDAFEERRPTVVEVDGREVGILRWNGDVFAVRNICPHMLAPVCRGTAMALITSDEQGRPQADATHKVRAYSTTVEGGRVRVMAGRPNGAAALAPAPDPAGLMGDG